jgi:beta-galactosidase
MKIYLAALSLLLNYTAIAQHTSRTSFNKDWKFKLDSTQSYEGVNVNDAGWRTLDLPHDWSIEGSFSKDNPAGTGGGALPGGMGWYRKTFIIPASQKNKQVFIEFDGVYRNSEVFINGHSAGMRPYGYSSFHYDITPYLKYGDAQNVIVVKADNSKQPNSRWYSGSGIYRNVWLTVLDKTHIDHWGTFITTPIINENEATVNISTKISNAAAKPTLLTTIYDDKGNTIATAEASAQEENFQKITIKQPRLWSVERPYLYKAVSQLKIGVSVVDTYETTFGIRYFNFDANTGFSLNGKPLKILGVCNHHDLGALGAAINTRALERQLELLKAMGCNSIRTSHNPPAPELLSLADRMGFLIMDEVFDMWAKSKTKYDYHLDWDKWHKKDLEDLILRDRNHPSVFIWSVGNEIMEQWGDDPHSQEMARELVGIVKERDTTRPIVTANNEINSYNNLIRSGAFELVGYNYNHARWGNFNKEWPGKKLIITESTSALETRGHYDLVPADTIRRWPKRWDLPLENGNPDLTVSASDHVSAPGGSTHEESVRELKKHALVSGMYIWTGFDYLGEPTPYPWPARSSYFGIIDLAGFPKDVYYMYQAAFTNTPVLHIFPHWNWKQGDTVDVVCYYNNADEVELFLNGRSLGTQSKKGDALHVKWRVPFAPGVVKAVSKKNGSTVLSKEIKTAGAPYKLMLKADRNKIKADGDDLSFVTVEVTDRDGVIVPDANNLIKFSLSGPAFIAGVDSGDPVSLEPFKSNQHTALNGKALCIVRSNGRKGEIKLTASAAGLLAATVTLKAD